MHTFAQKQNQALDLLSFNPKKSSVMLSKNDEKHDARQPYHVDTGTTRFAYDFSRVPVHTKAPVKLQTKLAVSSPGDSYELEADSVAEKVLNMSAPKLQRACACGGECSKCRSGQAGKENKYLQMKSVETDSSIQTEVSPMVNEVLGSAGQPLDSTTRAFMEPRFGYDFSGVRVHTDAKAAKSAENVFASAYTVGRHVVFNHGKYSPGTDSGKKLLAHELTHVLQQSGSGKSSANAVQMSRQSNVLQRQYRNPVFDCEALGVPCPSGRIINGVTCRLIECLPSRTGGPVSPGICVFQCRDNNICTCVLVGNRRWAVCTFTFCGNPGQPSSMAEQRDQAVAAAEGHIRGLGSNQGGGSESPAGERAPGSEEAQA